LAGRLRIQNVLFRPCEELGCPLCGGSISQIGAEPPIGNVIKVEKLGGSPIREDDLKASGQRDGFVPNNANPGGHPCACGGLTLRLPALSPA